MRSPLPFWRHATHPSAFWQPILACRLRGLTGPTPLGSQAAPGAERPGRSGRLLSPAGLVWVGLTVLGACQSPRPPLVYQPIWTASGVIIQDQIVPTDGLLPEAAPGDRLTIHYRAWLSDGTLVDSSYERGLPVDFTLGAGEVPEGLELGLLGMRLMGRRALFVPADLAYGDAGLNGQVPPDERVRFVVELLAIEPAPAQQP